MTLLLFFNPVYPQPRGERIEIPTRRKRGRRRTKKIPDRVIEDIAFELQLPEVRGYVEDILRREAEVIRLREEAIRRAEEAARLRKRKEEEQLIAEAEALQREAEAEERSRIAELIEEIGAMVRRALVAKRKRLNMMIASIMEWL